MYHNLPVPFEIPLLENLFMSRGSTTVAISFSSSDVSCQTCLSIFEAKRDCTVSVAIVEGESLSSSKFGD